MDDQDYEKNDDDLHRRVPQDRTVENLKREIRDLHTELSGRPSESKGMCPSCCGCSMSTLLLFLLLIALVAFLGGCYVTYRIQNWLANPVGPGPLFPTQEKIRECHFREGHVGRIANLSSVDGALVTDLCRNMDECRETSDPESICQAHHHYDELGNDHGAPSKNIIHVYQPGLVIHMANANITGYQSHVKIRQNITSTRFPGIPLSYRGYQCILVEWFDLDIQVLEGRIWEVESYMTGRFCGPPSLCLQIVTEEMGGIRSDPFQNWLI